jgi:hypothetical protein
MLRQPYKTGADTWHFTPGTDRFRDTGFQPVLAAWN